MRILFLSLVFVFFHPNSSRSQKSCYWQQEVDYVMEIDMDVRTYQFKGKQKLTYTNNSPDVLKKVVYHLYFNAFQPNSEMDIRLQNIKDPDPRMMTNIGTLENPVLKSKISLLNPNEIGFLEINSLTQNKKALRYTIDGTILEVFLNKPIQPGKKAIFEMEFLGQVPKQVRRSGRNNKEGVALSMTQWYPKMAVYDVEGWHAQSYIGREFYGEWGDFDVILYLEKKYTVGGTGILQNPEEVGHGYSQEGGKLTKREEGKLKWHFKAQNVHDFTWAADPDFTHDVILTKEGTALHFFYKSTMTKSFLQNWKDLQPKTAELLSYYNQKIGTYPYPQYSVIQGGDGGMEYGMCTLITGERSFGSLVGVVAHELAHSWFQFVLATNESKYPWMDEGFATYISQKAEDKVLERFSKNPNKASYDSYYKFVKYNISEPMTTPADYYRYNYVYGVSSYDKGAMFLKQLAYVIGEDPLEKALQKYYVDFKFKHPTPQNFLRTVEKISGISLDWYYNNWIETTRTIDYSVSVKNGNEIVLERIGSMHMPIDLLVSYEDGTDAYFYIPIVAMRGAKESRSIPLKDWSWVAPKYRFSVQKKIQSVSIDPLELMADINKSNNSFTTK
jgi:hypothetical protein